MKIYLQILKEYKLNLILIPILVSIYVICDTYQPYLLASIIDNGVINKDINVVTSVGLKMLVLSVIALLVNFLNVYISAKTAIGFTTNLREKLFSKIQTFSFSQINKFDTSSLITRLTGDISRVQMLLIMTFRMLLRSPIIIIMSLYFTFKMNTDIACILLFSIPFLAFGFYITLKKGFPLFIKVQEKIDNINRIVRENLLNIRVVKSFVREDYEQKKFNKSSRELHNSIVKSANVMIIISPLIQLFMNVSIVLVLWFGGHKVFKGDLKVGELISFINYFAHISLSLTMITIVFISYVRGSASSKRILEVLKTNSPSYHHPTKLNNDNKITEGSISFDKVTFNLYDFDTSILKDITFNIKSGETIAIAGVTGSGKSTLLYLINRIYNASKGTIKIDGIDINEYNYDEIHRNISIVLQNNYIFTGSIIDNITMGNKKLLFDDIVYACKCAQAHDFITSFPNGYDTILGKSGVNISGGQKQRICIARSLLIKPKIIIFDDSTSAVDFHTEEKIHEGITKYLGHSTTKIFVTQRVKIMSSADKVIVLDDGLLKAYGNPDELLKTSIIYKEIFNSQQIKI